MLINIHSAKCIGIEAVDISVEIDIAQGLGIHLVGLADAAVKESLLRTITALQSLGFRIPGKKIVIIDSCHSGQMIGRSGEASSVTNAELTAFNRQVVTTFTQQARSDYDLANSGYYVITAAHSTEDRATMGYDADNDGILDKRFGLFTYSMCYGNGWNMATNAARTLTADSDSDGVITLNEAYSYARYKAQQSNPNQTAQVYPTNSNMVVWAK